MTKVLSAVPDDGHSVVKKEGKLGRTSLTVTIGQSMLRTANTNIDARDDCKGLLTDPLEKGYCRQVIRKHPPTLCNDELYYRISQIPVCQTYCSLHRRCFFPLFDGKRCPNFRRRVDKLYCQDHAQDEMNCARLVEGYKHICNDGREIEPCLHTDDMYRIQENETFLANCANARRIHHRMCVHSTVRSAGHLAYLEKLDRYKNACSNMRWNIY